MLNSKYFIKALFCFTIIFWMQQCYGKELNPSDQKMHTSGLTKEEMKIIEKIIESEEKRYKKEFFDNHQDINSRKLFKENWAKFRNEAMDERRKMWIETAIRMKSEIVPIVFYGKVIDQYGQPVKDANVTVHIDQEDIRHSLEPDYGGFLFGKKDITLKTDENGVFRIEDKGRSLSIDSIEKSGFEVDKVKILKTFDYHIYKQDISNPFLFKLRKRGELAFLTTSDLTLSLRRGIYGEELYKKNLSKLKKNKIEVALNEGTGLYDEIHREYKLDLRTTHYIDSNYVKQEEQHYDLKVEIDYIQEKSAYEVNIVTLDPNSGLILSDELLYEAPESDYQPQIFLEYEKLTPEQSLVEIQKYLYIKSRTNPIYSRAVLNIEVSDSFLFKIEAFTNPTGSRNLEYDREWNSKERLRRVKERHIKSQREDEQQQKEWEKLKEERKKQGKKGKMYIYPAGGGKPNIVEY